MDAAPARRVVVIGAGFAGLSAALHLAGAGHDVTVVERHEHPGGWAAPLQIDGYRFDAGPTVLTGVGFAADALAAVGERLADHVDLVRLDPAYRARFADGSRLDVHADPDVMAGEIARVCGRQEVAGYRALVAWLTGLYERELPAFLARNLDSPLALLGPAGLDVVLRGGLRSLDHMVGRFVRDDRLRRVFTFQALYAGVSPWRARALYGVIPYLDCVAGVWFPRGGVTALAAGMATGAGAHGVAFRNGTAVERIDVRAGRVRGVVCADGGGTITADAVVVTAGLPGAYATLLPGLDPPRRVSRSRYSPSCVLLHLGTTTDPGDVAHHEISFGHEWRRTFTELDHGRLMRDPSFLLSTPTVTDPSLAPDGRHTRYVLFPAPNLDTGRSIDWPRLAPRYRDEMLAVLAARGHGEPAAGAEVERLTTPADWAAAGATAGTPFAAAHTLAQTGPFRPTTRDTRVRGLLFAGAHVQPGVGVPTSVLSGQLAAARLT